MTFHMSISCSPVVDEVNLTTLLINKLKKGDVEYYVSFHYNLIRICCMKIFIFVSE